MPRLSRFLCAFSALLSLPLLADQPVRERVSLNDGWMFHKGDAEGVGDTLAYSNIKPWLLPSTNGFVRGIRYERPAGNAAAPGEKIPFVQPDFDASGWRRLDLPHDFGIEGPFMQELPGASGKLPWFGIAWYRKDFELPKSDEGRRIRLEVDGAMSYATVWCNGRFVGGWPYGYASWQLDLTPYVKPGQRNTLAIRVDNPQNSTRWYPGGGIYRNVWLTKTASVHVGQWGTFVTTPDVSAEAATVEVRVSVVNTTRSEAQVSWTNRIFAADADGHATGAPLASSSGANLAVPPDHPGVATDKIRLENPRLWGPGHPALYVVVTELEQGGSTVDRYETTFGVRKAEFTANDGFHLNGVRVPLNGVCMHHDLGALGAAFNERAAQRQLEILREMGCNAIRTSHNPPAPELLDLCDRMGFLVLDELTDTWLVPKTPNGYARLFPEWSEADLRAFVRRDRNHPSVILWSTGNEIGEQRRSPEFSERLTEICHSEDPTRPTTAGCDQPQAGTNGFQKTVDAFGYNYKPHLYESFHKANPDQPLYGSETSSTISSRGEYLFPVDGKQNGGKIGFQMSSYDLYAPGWAQPVEVEFAAQQKFPFVAGEFVWTGFDYLGEPTPFNSDTTVLTNFHTPEDRAKAEAELKAVGKLKVPSRSSYFGIVDLAGFKKDRFFLYQARWRPELRMAHILPHWNWPERVGQVTPVHVYTSGDEGELFLNGKSLGRRKPAPGEIRLRWDEVKYEPGELKVVTYKNGERWAEDQMVTSGAPAKLSLSADRSQIRRDGRDLAFITVTIVDAEGRQVPRSSNLVQFEVEGPASIVATDNGDPTDHTVFGSPERKTFNGLALVIVSLRPGTDGKVIIRAKSQDLSPAQIVLSGL